MNQRQRKLFLYLLPQKHYQPIQELYRELGFSKKTIRNDIKTINVYLYMNEVTSRIQVRRGSGVWAHLTEREEEYVRYLSESGILEIKLNLDRFYRGMILLLFRQESYTTGMPADELYTGRLQLKEDLLCQEDMLRMFHLKVMKGAHLYIDGSERQLHLFVLYYFYQRVDKAVTMNIGPAFLQEHQSLFRSTLRLYEDAYQYCFTVNALHYFSIYLGVMMERIQMGYGLQGQTPYMGNGRTYTMLQDYFHADVNGEKMWSLEQLVESRARRWNRSMLYESVVSGEARQLTAHLFASLKQGYYGKPDEELPIPFPILLQTAMIRKHRAVRVSHYNNAQVKSDPMTGLLSVMHLFHKDEELRGLQLYEGEYICLSVLLLPYFHRLDMQVCSHIGMIIDCSSELAYYGHVWVSKALPDTDTVRILAKDEIDVATTEVGFLTAFGYLRRQVPNVEISSTVQDSDIQKLRLYLGQLRQQRSALQLISCSMRAHHVADENALVSYLFRCYRENYKTSIYEEFTAIPPMHRFLLHNYMLVVLYNERFNEPFILMTVLKRQLCIEGKEICQVCLIGSVHTPYERLREQLMQLKECLYKQLSYLM